MIERHLPPHEGALPLRYALPVAASRPDNGTVPSAPVGDRLLFGPRGNGARAVDSTLTSLAVARSLEPEPILISQLVRISCESLAVEGLQRTLSESKLSDDQLRRVAEVLHQHEMAGEKAPTMRRESPYFGLTP